MITPARSQGMVFAGDCSAIKLPSRLLRAAADDGVRGHRIRDCGLVACEHAVRWTRRTP